MVVVLVLFLNVFKRKVGEGWKDSKQMGLAGTSHGTPVIRIGEVVIFY